MSGRVGSKLRIELLGGFRVAVGSKVVDESAWRLRKARALVKLLALAPEHSMHREQAIDALWPALEPVAASNNLRQALFVARRALDRCGDAGAARLELALDTLTLSTDGLRIGRRVRAGSDGALLAVRSGRRSLPGGRVRAS